MSGCAAPESRSSAEALSERVLPQGYTTLDLEYLRELHDGGGAVTGYAWRLAREVSAAQMSPDSPTHLGVLACVRGDGATEAVQFSYLHWDVVGCDGGRAELRRVQRTSAQDAGRIGAVISRPTSPLESSADVRRATA
jgi:hypothetical protein